MQGSSVQAHFSPLSQLCLSRALMSQTPFIKARVPGSRRARAAGSPVLAAAAVKVNSDGGRSSLIHPGTTRTPYPRVLRWSSGGQGDKKPFTLSLWPPVVGTGPQTPHLESQIGFRGPGAAWKEGRKERRERERERERKRKKKKGRKGVAFEMWLACL